MVSHNWSALACVTARLLWDWIAYTNFLILTVLKITVHAVSNRAPDQVGLMDSPPFPLLLSVDVRQILK